MWRIGKASQRDCFLTAVIMGTKLQINKRFDKEQQGFGRVQINEQQHRRSWEVEDRWEEELASARLGNGGQMREKVTSLREQEMAMTRWEEEVALARLEDEGQTGEEVVTTREQEVAMVRLCDSRG
ncbi:hypothetical protein ACLOJK_028103 [Asimina triloba]